MTRIKFTAAFLVLLVVAVAFRYSEDINNYTTTEKLDLDIVYIGNSITYGANLEHPKQYAPSVISTEQLRKKAGINSASFSNQGRSGFTTVDFLPQTEAFKQVVRSARRLHVNLRHKLVFSIELGTNDSAIEGPKGSPVSKEDYYNNMKSIIDSLLIVFPYSVIVLQQPIWYSDNTYNRAKYLAEGLDRLQSYFPEIRRLVEHYAKTHPYRVHMGDQIGFGYFRNNYLTHLIPENGREGTFYLHPNKAGAATLGSLWADAIYEAAK